MHRYQVKKATDLEPSEIEVILQTWNVEEWNQLSVTAFKKLFHGSAFHLLLDNTHGLLSIARLNFDFKLQIGHTIYAIPEFVGFISVQKSKGFGSTLLRNIISNLRSRNIEALGFCEKELRPFYEKCAVPILYNQARFLKEPVNNEWKTGTDDDILCLHLSNDTVKLLEGLNDAAPAYLTI